MSQYVRSIVVKRKFQNDEVTVTLKPVKFVDALKFKSLDAKNLKEEDFAPLFDTLKGYVVALAGLKADDASDVSVDELFSASFFAGFLIDVLTEWLERGTPQNP